MTLHDLLDGPVDDYPGGPAIDEPRWLRPLIYLGLLLSAGVGGLLAWAAVEFLGRLALKVAP